jgi:hypothetical protein
MNVVLLCNILLEAVIDKFWMIRGDAGMSLKLQLL